MSLLDHLHEKEKYTDYADGLSSEERNEARAFLLNLLINQEITDHGPQSRPPEELITRHYLEALFPDEESAAAYLFALDPRNKDGRIREIEGDKDDATRGLRSHLTNRHRKHLQILEMAWGLRDGSLHGEHLIEQIRILIRGAEGSDDESAQIFNSWVDAELTRVKMRNFIIGLRNGPKIDKASVTRGTFLQGKIDLRNWILAAALVAQARQSPTAGMIAEICKFKNRTTPNRMLNKMRLAMLQQINNLDDRPVSTTEQIYNLIPNHTLHCQLYSHWHNDLHREDLVISRIGQLRITKNTMKRNLNRDKHVTQNGNSANKIIELFKKWIYPHRKQIKSDKHHLLFAEFAFKYNCDKDNLIGWRAINKLLLELLKQPPQNDLHLNL